MGAAAAKSALDFTAIHSEYQRYVLNLCKRWIGKHGDYADVQDLSQEIWLQIHRKLHTFKGRSQLRTWIYRLAFNLFLMKVIRRSRAKRKLHMFSLEQLRDLGDPRWQEPVVHPGDPAVCLAIMREIEQLAPGYRMVVLLRAVEGMEHKEVAAALGYTIGSSKSQQHRARKILRERMGIVGC